MDTKHEQITEVSGYEQLVLFDTEWPPADRLFTEADVIHTYTRTDAIEDGVLVDVTEMAQEAGFKIPVAVTAAVWSLIHGIPPRFQGIQDIDGRAWDVLWMASLAARRNRGESALLYRLILHHGHKTYATLKMTIGPGDDGEPVVTILLPDED